MKKRFKYKPEKAKQEEETLLAKIVSFPGYFMIAVAWLFVAVSGLYALLGILNADQGYSTDQPVLQPELTYQSSSIIVLSVIGVVVWCFIARFTHRILNYIYGRLSPTFSFVLFCTAINALGWLLFLLLVGLIWSLNSWLILIVSLGGFIVGSLSFLVSSLVYKTQTSEN